MNPAFRVEALELSDPCVRPIAEFDGAVIADLFRQNYGDSYLAADVYDGTWVKRCVYGDSVIGLVIEERGKVVAAGALLLNLGDYDDRSAELARLVVDPRLAGHGLGSRLVKALVDAADESLDYGESHARTAHLHSQHMLEENAFIPIGFLPEYVRGEHLVPYARIFGDAAKLRSAQAPQPIPEALPLARFVLGRLGCNEPETTSAAPLPIDRGYGLKPLDSRSLDGLLALRQRQQEQQLLIGNLSIDHGMSAIRNRKAAYLVAVDAMGGIAGALGFQADQVSGIAKAIELVGEDPAVLGFLCREFVEQAESPIMEVTVSAHAPALQQTFWKLGFRPVAYAPAVAFQGSYRKDGLRMVLGNVWRKIDPAVTRLTETCQLAAELVNRGSQL